MKFLKRTALLACVFCAVLLVGCGRSDVVLTVNEDGSFSAQVTYGIDKSLMGNDEVKEQVKALITDSLEQNNIPYTEAEDDSFVTVCVTRDFADINELTSAESWKGISMVPKFSKEQAAGGLWTRIEGRRLKIDGSLDAETFGAKDFIEQNGELSDSFGGSLTIVSHKEPESTNGEKTETGYKWSGKGNDKVNISYSGPKLNVSDSVEESPKKDAAALKAESEAEENGESADGSAPFNPAAPLICALILAAVAVAAIFVRRKRDAKGESEFGREKAEAEKETEAITEETTEETTEITTEETTETENKE